MKKKINLAILCFLLFFYGNITTINATSIDKTHSSDVVSCITNETAQDLPFNNEPSSNSFKLIYEKNHFLLGEKITVCYQNLSGLSVLSYSYSQIGIDFVSINTDSNDSRNISVELSYNQAFNEVQFILYTVLEDGSTCSASLYAVITEYGVFISQFSIDDAREIFFAYATRFEIMTEDQCKTMRMQYYRNGVINTNLQFLSRCYEEEAISPTSKNAEETHIVGALEWKDDANNIHPLRRIKVDILGGVGNDVVYLSTTYTDDLGYFEYTSSILDYFYKPNDGTYDIFIRAFAGDENIMVKIGDSSNEYYYESQPSDNIVIGAGIVCCQLFDMTTDLGKAFQISQAIITARDYAKEMIGETPQNVIIRYPYDDGCYYEHAINRITITGDSYDNYLHSYSSWDVIMHEYGHHIQYELGIIEHVGGVHYFDTNLCDQRQSKNAGIHLAWSEAWATIFAMQAQKYYAYELQDVNSINNTTYDAYNFGYSYPIEENTTCLGEGCEASVMAILWDLCDNSNETNDTIYLGHEDFWAITTSNNIKSLSDFINHFYSEYPEYIDDLGANLSYYQIAPSFPTILNPYSVSYFSPPTFTWESQGGSIYFLNTEFRLIFYDGLGVEIFRTPIITDNSYTLTQSEWRTIVDLNSRSTYTVAVSAIRIDLPTTGEYISAKSQSYAKPEHSHLYTDHYLEYNTYKHRAYCECGEYILEEHSLNLNYQCWECGDEHEHTYGERHEWVSETKHTSYCLCGESKIEGHVINQSAAPFPGRLKVCLLCGGLASEGFSQMAVGSLPHTENGSYITPDGITVLADEDIEAFLNGTLEFIYPSDSEAS